MISRPTFDVNSFDPAKLDKLSQEEFRALVDADLRRRAPKSTVVLRPELADALREQPNLDRWYSALVRMAKSVDLQLAARRDDYRMKVAQLRSELTRLDAKLAAGEALRDPDTNQPMSSERAAEFVMSRRMRIHNAAAEYAKTRAGTLRFKTGLEDTLLEARFAREQAHGAAYTSMVAQERNSLAQRATRLEEAIRAHQRLVNDPGCDDAAAEEADHLLWAAVDPAA